MTNNTKHWWKPASEIEAGDRLGDLSQGVFAPAVVVLSVTPVEGSSWLLRIATAAGSFTVPTESQFYVFDAEVTA